MTIDVVVVVPDSNPGIVVGAIIIVALSLLAVIGAVVLVLESV